MSSTHLNIEHLCHMVRRQVAEEFRGLELIFIVHTNGNRAKAIEQKQNRLGKNAHGRSVADTLMRYSEHNKSSFAGLIKTQPKGPLSLFQKTEKTAIFFLNTDEYEDLETAKTHLYDLLWYALDITKQSEMKPTLRTAKIENIDGVLMHAQDKMNEATHNLMADVFTSVFIALQGQPNHIKQLGIKRAQDSLSNTAHSKPEQHPFPIALESTEIIFQDFKNAGKERPLYNALKMAREVGETHTNDMIKQWWAFCSRAQNMAWHGHSPQKNISTAIYTSENTYIKSTAYIVAEILNIEPTIITNLTSYNPYSDNDVNAHLHQKKCETDAKAIAEIAVSSNQEHIFDEIIMRQCGDFIEGKPLGFSPLGAIAAKIRYTEQSDDPDLTGQSIRAAYMNGCAETPWSDIEKLITLYVHAKRKGRNLKPEQLTTLMKHVDGLGKARAALQKFFKKEPQETIESNAQKKTDKKPAILTDDDFLEMPDDIALNITDDKKEDPASS